MAEAAGFTIERAGKPYLMRYGAGWQAWDRGVGREDREGAC